MSQMLHFLSRASILGLLYLKISIGKEWLDVRRRVTKMRTFLGKVSKYCSNLNVFFVPEKEFQFSIFHRGHFVKPPFIVHFSNFGFKFVYNFFSLFFIFYSFIFQISCFEQIFHHFIPILKTSLVLFHIGLFGS